MPQKNERKKPEETKKYIDYMYDGCMMQIDAIENHCTPVYNCK
jgi:hypothetical protein